MIFSEDISTNAFFLFQELCNFYQRRQTADIRHAIAKIATQRCPKCRSLEGTDQGKAHQGSGIGDRDHKPQSFSFMSGMPVCFCIHTAETINHSLIFSFCIFVSISWEK